jgi:hypothetical protein
MTPAEEWPMIEHAVAVLRAELEAPYVPDPEQYLSHTADLPDSVRDAVRVKTVAAMEDSHRRDQDELRRALDLLLSCRSMADLIRELLDAHDAVEEAMYDRDLSAAWRQEKERWSAAERAARAYPGVGNTRAEAYR